MVCWRNKKKVVNSKLFLLSVVLYYWDLVMSMRSFYSTKWPFVWWCYCIHLSLALFSFTFCVWHTSFSDCSRSKLVDMLLPALNISHKWCGVFHSRLETFLFSKSFLPYASIPSSGWFPGIVATHCLAVTGGGNIGKCGRLSQPTQLAFSTHYSHTYLLT